MEVYQEGFYWRIRNVRGPVPKELKGDWVSKHKAEEAVHLFQQQVRSRAVNVSQRNRERQQRAASNTPSTV
jgi:hypothetical protein